MLPTTGRAARALLGSAALLCACGHTLPQAVHIARQGLHAVAIEAQEDSKAWVEQVDARIEYCRRQSLQSEEERAKCMGVFGRGDAWEDDLEDLLQAYDAAAGALEQLEAAAARLEARKQGRDPEAP